MIKWLHHLFNPHCEKCAEDQERNRYDLVVDTLRQLLEAERSEKYRLLQLLTAVPEMPVEKEIDYSKFQSTNKYVPWRVRQQMLEKEARTPQTTEELEKELLNAN